MKVLIYCLSLNFTLLTYQESFPCTHNFYIVFASDTDTGESEGNGIHHDGMDHPSIVYGPVNQPLPVKNESSDVKQVIPMHKLMMMMVWTTLALSTVLLILFQ